jgi:hypothetical protein
VREQRAAGLGEGQIAQFVEDDEIQVHQLMRQTPGTAAGDCPNGTSGSMQEQSALEMRHKRHQ